MGHAYHLIRDKPSVRAAKLGRFSNNYNSYGDMSVSGVQRPC